MHYIVDSLSYETTSAIERAARKNGSNLYKMAKSLLKEGRNSPEILHELAEFACRVVIGSLAERARAVSPKAGLEFFATEDWARHAAWTSRGLTSHAGEQSTGIREVEAGQ